MLLLILFLALLSPWFMALAALLWTSREQERREALQRHPSAQRFQCPVCGSHVIAGKNNSLE